MTGHLSRPITAVGSALPGHHPAQERHRSVLAKDGDERPQARGEEDDSCAPARGRPVRA